MENVQKKDTALNVVSTGQFKNLVLFLQLSLLDKNIISYLSEK